MIVNNEMYCCGVEELSGIQDYANAERALKHILSQWCNTSEWDGDPPKMPAFAVFTTNGEKNSKTGVMLRDLIQKHKLGRVTVPQPNRNEKSNNQITMYMWRLNHRNIRRYYRSL